MNTKMQTIKAGTLIEGKNADGRYYLHRVREAHDDGVYTVETLVLRNFVGEFTYGEILSKYRVRRTKNELHPSNRSGQFK